MDEQPVNKIWACKKKMNPNPDIFITENKTYAREARSNGYRCTRLHEMEKALYGKTLVKKRKKKRRARKR